MPPSRQPLVQRDGESNADFYRRWNNTERSRARYQEQKQQQQHSSTRPFLSGGRGGGGEVSGMNNQQQHSNSSTRGGGGVSDVYYQQQQQQQRHPALQPFNHFMAPSTASYNGNQNHASVLSAEAMRDSRFSRNINQRTHTASKPPPVVQPNMHQPPVPPQQQQPVPPQPQQQAVTPGTQPGGSSPAQSRAKRIRSTLLKEGREATSTEEKTMKKKMFRSMNNPKSKLYSPIMRTIRASVEEGESGTDTPDCKENLLFAYEDHPELGL